MLIRMKGKLTLTLALALVGALSLPITSLGHPLKLSASLVEFDPQEQDPTNGVQSISRRFRT